jgi:spermine/spermidine synthase
MGLVFQNRLIIGTSMVLFYAVLLAVVSLSVLLLELTLTRIFSIILWYDYAFMAISIAFFGLGIGSLVVHIAKNRLRKDIIPIYLLKTSLAFAISISVFLLVTSYLIPPSIDYLYLFYLAASIPFLFAGIAIALIFYSRPRDISKLYFLDLMGSAAAALLLDPLLRGFGAEYTLVFVSLLISMTCVLGLFVIQKNSTYFSLRAAQFLDFNRIAIWWRDLISHNRKYSKAEQGLNHGNITIDHENRKQLIRLLSISLGLVIIFSLILVLSTSHANLISIKPGEKKGLYYQLSNPTDFEHLFTEWNSFSRIDVTRQIHNATQSQSLDTSGRSRTLAAIAIDADADTPVIRWNGTSQDLEWIKHYMDFLPYEISKTNSTLVIGSGGGEDVLASLAGGSRNVTAVEINPLIIEAAKQFGEAAGNLYDRDQVELVIDEGRRYLSGTESKFDLIMIKLVDSWAAQLAGGYALSENYLYTVEAFKQYLEHLNKDHGMLVMIRWNIELPRLIPLIYESLREYGNESPMEPRNRTDASFSDEDQEILNKIIIVENKPGLYFLPSGEGSIYPVLVMIKQSAFTKEELEKVKQRVSERNATAILLPTDYVQTRYEEALTNNMESIGLPEGNENLSFSSLPSPTDDSPFFFARERIPSQLIVLLTTVLILSGVLFTILIYYSKLNKIDLVGVLLSKKYYLVFATCIGFGFMFFEITLIQKFLLVLGTPVLALTVILFSILVATGMGSFASGKLFPTKPDYAIKISIPLLMVITLGYYIFINDIIYQSIVLSVYDRITLSIVLLIPLGFLMGFQFPSIIRLATAYKRKYADEIKNQIGTNGKFADSDGTSSYEINEADDHIVTLIWGVNIIASVIGSVLAVISSMLVGLDNTLLVGMGFYMGAFVTMFVISHFSRD